MQKLLHCSGHIASMGRKIKCPHIPNFVTEQKSSSEIIGKGKHTFTEKFVVS
jgi:hypothetical protein